MIWRQIPTNLGDFTFHRLTPIHIVAICNLNKSDVFDDALNLNVIDMRWSGIECIPEWLKALGFIILMSDNSDKEEITCRSCLEEGTWSNGTNDCRPCHEEEICMNDEWDETGTFRIKSSRAGGPPHGES